MSLFFPKVKPSYHFFTSAFLSPIPYSSNAENTSSSVKPKLSAYCSDVDVTTVKLFRSENIDSNASQEAMLTLVIPVMMARSRYGFVLNVALNRFRINSTISLQ